MSIFRAAPTGPLVGAVVVAGLGFGSGYVFHIDDASKHIDIIDADIVWRISGMDSTQVTRASACRRPLRLAASLPFSTGSGVTWECLDSPVPDIHVTQFEAGAEVGFDGTVTPICTALASIDVPVVGVEDVSGQVESGVLDKVNAAMQDPQVVSFLAADRVRSYLDFFSRLLRLDAQAQIQAYRSDGTTLFVDYTLPGAEPPGVHYVPVVEVGPPSTLTPSHRGEPAPPPPRFTPRRLRFIRRSRVLIRRVTPSRSRPDSRCP